MTEPGQNPTFSLLLSQKSGHAAGPLMALFEADLGHGGSCQRQESGSRQT